MIPQVILRDGYSISRIIKGGWQLSENHSNKIVKKKAIEDMFEFAEEGITTFDCADIYVNVESMIGIFLNEFQSKFGKLKASKIRVHTKYVPDVSNLDSVSFEDTEKIIDRSLKRLGKERLDVVQFHWWNYEIPRYVEVVNYLKKLQVKGKIENLSLTNFDIAHLEEVLDSGVRIFSNQIQYSMLDHRPEHGMIDFCVKNDIKIFCYGTIAGGFLSNRYLGINEPVEPFENRSLTKYKLIIDDVGGWDFFQHVLNVLSILAKKHKASITNIATKFILEQKGIDAIIVGARNISHIDDNKRIFEINLDNEDRMVLKELFTEFKHLPEDIYSIERIKGGKHAGIMKYNLNSA